MAEFTSAPWFAEIGAEVAVIRGSDGDSICAMRLATGDRNPPEQVANAHLIALAPELFARLAEAADVMRRCDPGFVDSHRVVQTSDDEFVQVLDEIEALLAVAAEAGLTCEGGC